MKKSLATTSLLAGLILLIFLVYARTTDAQGSSESSQIQIGMDIAPVHLDLKGKNRSLVGLGSYIVNAQGGCNDCHTWRITTEARPISAATTKRVAIRSLASRSRSMPRDIWREAAPSVPSPHAT